MATINEILASGAVRRGTTTLESSPTVATGVSRGGGRARKAGERSREITSSAALPVAADLDASSIALPAAAAGQTQGQRLGQGLTLERLAGCVVEVSSWGGGGTTVAARWVWEAQTRREMCAWAMNPANGVYVPDLAAVGIDLAALAVVRVAQPVAAAECLVRSGAFGVVVVDGVTRSLSAARLQRLATPARQHGTAVVVLTRKALGEASLGVWVSLHVYVSRVPAGAAVGGGVEDGAGAGFVLRIAAIKDKRQGGAWQYEESADGPPGVCGG